MNINFSNYNLSFQKKLMANANVIKDNEPCPVSIYKLDKKDDKNYLKNLSEKDKNWQYSFYLDKIQKEFEHSLRLRLKNGSKLEFYTLEDKDQNCLGLVEVDNGKKEKQNVAYLERFPADYQKHRYKYIGETLLSFLAKQQKAAKAPRKIVVDNAMIEAQEFYLKSHFKYMYDGCTYNQMYLPTFDCDEAAGHNTSVQDKMFLPKYNDDLLLESNKNHTGSEIELVG